MVTTLADVQKNLLELIHAETIIIGHSLENDLNCMKVGYDIVYEYYL